MFNEALSPKQWGARVDYDRWAPDTTKDKWILHYGGGAVSGYDEGVDREMAVLRAWEYHHMRRRGWRGIAYNYAIGDSGTLYRLRGETAGGHTRGDYEPDGRPENIEGRAVVFILGGSQEPSLEALITFALMWGEDPMPVIGHTDVFLHGTGGTNTPCPGKYLHAWLKAKKHETLYKEITTMATTFDDVPATHAFFEEIETLADAGIARGRRSGGKSYFDPETPVTRGQMAAFLIRTAAAIKAGKL
jgi:hypothetical protein